jgi:xylulokinase
MQAAWPVTPDLTRISQYLLGVDIGGTGAKAGVFDLGGRPVGSGYVEYRLISTLPGKAEHDAEAWWQAAVQAIRQATAGHPPGEVAAVGVSCTNGLVAVDRQARPLRPAIMLWDQRSLPQVQFLRDLLGSEVVLEVSGNPVAPGAYALPTLLWLREHEPETYAAAHCFMVPGGYLVARLTGELTIDYSRACTTLLFDIQRRAWHQPFIDALGLDAGKLPRPLPSAALAGGLTAEAAALTGLAEGTPVVAGCMDTLSAALGSGTIAPGEGFIIMGTAARVATALAEPRFDARFMHCTHLQPDRWLALGALNGVGSSLRWVRDNFGHAEQGQAAASGRDVYDLLIDQAAQAPPGSKGLFFLPYLSGERTPIWDPYARGVFFGVTLGHDRADFLRSVLEGAAFAMRHAVDILRTERDLDFRVLRVGGAAAANRDWMQIIADVLGLPLVAQTEAHIEVLGAALLAGLGLGLYRDVDEAKQASVRDGRCHEPNPRAQAAYDQLFPLYTSLYPAVRPYFERLAQLDLPRVWVTRGETDDR